MKTVQIFTDGACSGNPGPGGWGAILRYGTAEKELSGGAAETTNNRMELTGVISALAALKEPCQVLLTTDSKYVVDSITKGWVYGWKKRGWVKSDRPERRSLGAAAAAAGAPQSHFPLGQRTRRPSGERALRPAGSHAAGHLRPIKQHTAYTRKAPPGKAGLFAI